MSVYPYIKLVLILTSDDFTSKSAVSILEEIYYDDEGLIKIGNKFYDALIMKDNYDEDAQISAKKNNLVLSCKLSRGWGETVYFSDLEKLKKEIEAWAIEICNKHNCLYKIGIVGGFD